MENTEKKKSRVKNPLHKRIPRELSGDWKKYLVVSLFLILTISFVSGMYVANGSMLKAAGDGVEKYKLEDGHFELNARPDEALLSAIESGRKADVKQYYLDKAKRELDDKFESEFTEKFDAEFTPKFDEEFTSQIRQILIAQGLTEEMADAMLQTAVEQARESGAYSEAYDAAYKEAWPKAYDEAYEKAWKEIQDKIDEEYADAEEKYELNDPDFKEVPVKLYENFYRNEDEDYNNDGVADGTIRVYPKTEGINEACILKGRLPETEDEIAIDRMHADNVGIKVGDEVTVSGNSYKVVGLIAYVNYATLHEKSTDLMFDALKFDVAMVTDEGFARLGKALHYVYAWKYVTDPADEKEEKHFSDNFMKALLTQTVAGDNELEDYAPKYANPAITFATEDMGSDEAMGGVLLDILIVIIAFIFAVTISNTITKEASAIGTLRASGYTKGELVRHYLSMPVVVTLLAAAIGNLLGYTVFKNVVVGMYYNSYSLPTYETIWSAEAFLKTTLIPVVLMFVVNLIVIIRMMQHTPLQFLRHDLKKTKRKKAMRLPRWKFLSRFRLRIIFQNIPNYLILFFGIFFITVMLAMAVGMPATLDYYKQNAKDMLFAKYQYVLKSVEDEDGNPVDTENKDAERFDMYSLQKRGTSLDEEVSVYGIIKDSRYVKIEGLEALEENEVYISTSFRDKYSLAVGDTVQLVYLAGAGVIIDGDNVGGGILSAQLLDNALAHHMVRQTAEGLTAYNVGNTAVDQLHHLAGQKPAFTGLISDGYNRLCVFHQIADMGGGSKVLTLCQFLCCGTAQPLDCPDTKRGETGGFFAHAKLFRLVNLVVEAVEHEINQIRHHGLSALRFQKLHQMVVAGGRELDQNLAHDAYAGFLQILINGDGVKFTHNLTAHAVKGKEIHVLCGNKFLCTLHPFSVYGIHAAGF